MTPDKDGIIELIKQHGIYGLGGSDGCECMEFTLLGYSVQISCHKTEHTLRVFTNYLDARRLELIDIANTILPYLSSGYKVRFCSYDDDHRRLLKHEEGWKILTWVNDEARCCYCGARRTDENDYLCKACKSNQQARHSYPLELVNAIQPLP